MSAGLQSRVSDVHVPSQVRNPGDGGVGDGMKKRGQLGTKRLSRHSGQLCKGVS